MPPPIDVVKERIKDPSIPTSLHPTWHPPHPIKVGDKKMFTLQHFQITNTRSRHEDTLFISASLAVGMRAPVSVSRKLGDHNNGIFPLDISLTQVAGDDEAVVFSYTMINAGHVNDQELQKELEEKTGDLARKAADAAAAAIGAGIGTALGASIGTSAVPLLGTALGALAGWLTDSLTGLLFANCDGPVAAAVHLYKGSEISHPFNVTEYHPGVDSANGCGSNSKYYVTFSAISAPVL